MPRCFFNVANGVDVAIDHDESDLASLDIAMREAIEDHLGLAIEALRQRKPLPFSYRIQICDGLGRPLDEVPFSGAAAFLSEGSEPYPSRGGHLC